MPLDRQHQFDHRKRAPAARRRGLTLFELLLALAIFLASLAALAHLIQAGSRAAVEGRLQTQAILRCESKLAEVLAGAEPLADADGIAFEDDPAWTWSLELRPGPLRDLIELEMEVSHTGRSALANTSYRLTRFVRNPRIFRDRRPRPAVTSEPPPGGEDDQPPDPVPPSEEDRDA